MSRADDPPLGPIRIPVPALVVLVGAAGSGKSTFARRWFPPGSILSSDAFRAELGRDESDQSVTGAAFAWLHREVVQRLDRAELAVIDATNVRPRDRRALLRRHAAALAGPIATRTGLPAIAILFDVPPAIVHHRNEVRPDRVVPRDVVDRHLAALGRSTSDEALRAEGFDVVHRIGADGAGRAVELIPVELIPSREP